MLSESTSADAEKLSTAWLFAQQHLELEVLHDSGAPFDVVHPCELENPGEFVTPGAIVLLTGLAFAGRPESLHAYVADATAAGIVGIGLGVGMSFGTVPAELIDAARRYNLTLFAVPMPIPFVSILAAVHQEQENRRQQHRQALLEAQGTLSAAALRGIDSLLGETSSIIGAHMALVDEDGRIRGMVHKSGIPDIPAEELEELVSSRGFGSAGKVGPHHVIAHRMSDGGEQFAGIISARPAQFDSSTRMILRHCAGLTELLLQRPASMRSARQEINTLAMAVQLGWDHGKHSMEKVFAEISDVDGNVRPLLLKAETPLQHDKTMERLDRVMAMSSRYVYALAIAEDTSLLLFRGNRQVGSIREIMRGSLGTARLAVGTPRPWWTMDEPMIAELERIAFALQPGMVGEPRKNPLVWVNDPVVKELLTARRHDTWEKLEQYDAEHKAELVTTLETFLRLHGHVSKTADALHIHRQTLSKRLRLIEDHIEVDLDDSKVWADLMVTGLQRMGG